MNYPGNPIYFLEYNTDIIGKREVGQKDMLKLIIKHCYEHDYTVLLFDSTTDHNEGSILLDTKYKYPNNLIIPCPAKDEIHLDTICNNNFPYNLIEKTDYKIYSFDVSKCLQECYNDDSEEKNEVQLYNKQLIFQELTVMLPIISKRKCVVIMDEVEFIPCMKSIIEKYNSFNIKFIVCMHDSESLSTSSSLFDLSLIL